MSAFELFMLIDIEDAAEDLHRKGTKSVVTTNYRRGYLDGLKHAYDTYVWMVKNHKIEVK